MNRSFFCVDGHTCGCPVRMVVGGGPNLLGATMSEKRQQFLANWDWVRTLDVRAPRPRRHVGLDPLSPDHTRWGRLHPFHRDVRLPADVRPRHDRHGDDGDRAGPSSCRSREGRLLLDVPAGRVVAEYVRDGRFVEKVKLTNVPSYLAMTEVRVDCPELGELLVDVAYGGNFYAIVSRRRTSGTWPTCRRARSSDCRRNCVGGCGR